MRNPCVGWAAVVIALAVLGWAPGIMVAPAGANELIFLDISNFTGPMADLAAPSSQGLEDYLKDLEARGGLYGVHVGYVGVDTRYDVARAISAFKHHRRNPGVVAMNIVSRYLGDMLVELVGKERLVILAPCYGQYQARLGNFFTWGPTYQDVFAAALDWVVEDWKKKGRSGPPAVGVLSWDNLYGKEMLLGGREYAQQIGVKLLEPELFPPGLPEHNEYLTRLDEAGADYVYLGGVDPTQTHVMRDAASLGLTGKIQFISDYWGPSAGEVALHRGSLEGMMLVSFSLRGEEAQNHPLIQRIWTTYRKEPLEDMDERYGLGIVWGINLEAALKDLIKRAAPLSREELYRSYERITGVRSQGISGPCAYSPTSRRGSSEVKFYRVAGGKVEPRTDWIETPDAVSLHKW